uniref:C-type lectin domain family 4 member E n=1 Tax=Catagonus wagneri TaxID=51154 RepID=A0A8C3YE95_9CETA
MDSSKPPVSQCTERECFSSQVFLWTIAGVSILLLSTCFITRCVVTYQIFQRCDEKKFQSPDDIMELSCYNDEPSTTVPNLNTIYKSIFSCS